MGICWATPKNRSLFISPVEPDKCQSVNCISSSPENSSFCKNSSSMFFSSGDDESRSRGQNMSNPCLKIFSYSELKVATKNFRPEMVLGEGGFGIVYKGWLDEKRSSKTSTGSAVAIKKLISESVQGFEEWQSEVHFLGKLCHPNLVKLLGYCWEDEELLLVYEFMQKGSLENHLFGRGSSAQPLSWNLRLQIAIGAAEGLSFLHTLDNKVIYRDFKTSNILIDGSFTAKLSDFGLAKLGPSASQSHVSTRVIGTYGYAAPEYMATGHLYVRSDVYGFGIVLVEILTGLRALDPNRPAGQHSLGDWIKPYLADKRKLKSIMDSRLEGKCSFKIAAQVAQIALNCLGAEPKMRPHMKYVVENLKSIQAASFDHCNKGKEQVRSNSMAPVSTPKRCGIPQRAASSM